MTDDRLPLAELMAKTGDGDFLRTVAESVLQIIMEADVDGLIGAGRHERSGERSTWRNGYRDRSLDTRLGTLNLKIPKLRTGAYFPGFLEPQEDRREGAGQRHPGGMDRRREHPPRRRARSGDGDVRHLQVQRLEALQGHRRAGERTAGGRRCSRFLHGDRPTSRAGGCGSTGFCLKSCLNPSHHCGSDSRPQHRCSE